MKSLVNIRFRKLSSGRQSIYLEYNHDGIKDRVFLKLYLTDNAKENKETMRVVEAIKAKYITDIMNGKASISDSTNKYSLCDLFDLIVKSRQMEQATKLSYISVKRFIEKHKLNRKTAAFSDEYIQSIIYTFLRLEKHNTAAVYARKLICVINYALKKGYCRNIDVSKLDIPRQRTVERCFLTADELKEMINTETKSAYDLRLAFLFSCFSGLRYSDIQTLKKEDITDNRINKQMVKVKGKQISMMLNKQATEILKQAKGTDDFVFFLPKYNTEASRFVRHWAQRSGIKKEVTFHTARHTFATLLLNNNVDIFTVSKLLGHSDIKTTEIYAKLLDDAKNKAVLALDDIIKK